MTAKEILQLHCKHFDGYNGTLSVRKIKGTSQPEFYKAVTDGNTLDVARYENTSYIFYKEEGIIGSWIATNGLQKTDLTIEMNGKPCLSPFAPPIEETAEEISFSDFIKIKKEEKGFTQQQMCDLLGVPFRTYQEWEYGNRTPSRFVVDAVIAKLSD